MRCAHVKLWDPLRTRAISEHLRGVFTTRRYTVHVYLTFTLHHMRQCWHRLAEGYRNNISANLRAICCLERNTYLFYVELIVMLNDTTLYSTKTNAGLRICWHWRQHASQPLWSRLILPLSCRSCYLKIINLAGGWGTFNQRHFFWSVHSQTVHSIICQT